MFNIGDISVWSGIKLELATIKKLDQGKIIVDSYNTHRLIIWIKLSWQFLYIYIFKLLLVHFISLIIVYVHMIIH